jgi:hypothetical protein
MNHLMVEFERLLEHSRRDQTGLSTLPYSPLLLGMINHSHFCLGVYVYLFPTLGNAIGQHALIWHMRGLMNKGVF